MIRKMLAAIAGAVVVLVAGLPGVARATTVWVPASCATGWFDQVGVDPQGHYLTPAHMRLCEPHETRSNYEIVVFHGNGAIPLATGDKLQSYVVPSVTADVLPLLRPVPVFGLCLMRDVNTRTACIRIDTAADGTATSSPIEATDPLVADPVIFLQKPPVNLPNYCATCVTITF
jgi:hypothetical protein